MRKLPSFSQKSGNFLFVIRQLIFLGENECNKKMPLQEVMDISILIVR